MVGTIVQLVQPPQEWDKHVYSEVYTECRGHQHWQNQLTGRRFLGGSCISHRLQAIANRSGCNTTVHCMWIVVFFSNAHHAGAYYSLRLTCFDCLVDSWEEEGLPFWTEQWREMYIFTTMVQCGDRMCNGACTIHIGVTCSDQLTGKRFLGGSSCISHRLHVERNRRAQHRSVYITQ